MPVNSLPHWEANKSLLAVEKTKIRFSSGLSTAMQGDDAEGETVCIAWMAG